MSIDPTSSQGPIIGIDFGTTKTMVAEYDPVRKCAKVHKLGRGGDEMPTSIYVTEEGDVLFGDDADEEGVLDSPKHIRRFKMLLGNQTETPFGTKSVTPIELAAEFLSHVRKRLESEVFHRPVERLVLTVPAMFGPAQRKDLVTAAGRAGFASVELLAEPVAAGIAYCDHNTDLSTNLRFLVVDWGGGTFDLALVERNGKDECKVLGGLVDGCADIGGEDLDDELWIAVDGRVTGLGFQALGLQPKHEWGKYRRELTRAKEGLTARSQVPINLTVEGGKLARIPFSRAELEEVIAEKVQIGARRVAELVEQCRKNGSPPDFLLLAGGTSRIPMIAKVLEQVSGLPCRAWSGGRDAIALGASIHAHRSLENPASKPETKSAIQPNHKYKISAVAQYTSLLEGAWIDGEISNDERVFLGKKRKELGLTIEESQAIQIQVFGAPIGDVTQKNETVSKDLESARMSLVSKINQKVENKASFKIRLEKSSVGLQIVALAPEAHPEMQGEEFIQRTHFSMCYLINIENTSRKILTSVRVSLRSSDKQEYSILIPSIKPGKSGALSLSTVDFEGWMVTPGDAVTVDAVEMDPTVFLVTEKECEAIDQKNGLYIEYPCIVTVRKATFSSNFVLKITNIKNTKIKVSGFQSPAGTISSPIEIEPNAVAEIGFCELSENRNLVAGEEFLISIQGFRDVQGVIAEGKLKGSGAVWTVLGALGGIALAAAGGG